MKPIFPFLFFLSLITINSFGQAPSIRWQQIDTELGNVTSIQQTADGGYIMAGGLIIMGNSFTELDYGLYGNQDYQVVKMDSAGNIEWERSYGGSGYNGATSIRQTGDGGYIVAGFSNADDSGVTGNHGGYDYWIVKLDNGGNIKWEKSYGGNGDDIATSIQLTADGGYVVAGYSNSDNGDVTGHHLGIDSGYTFLGGYNFSNNHWYYSAGDNDFSSYDYWVLKIDSVGNILWEKSLGGTGDDIATSIQPTTDGGFIIAGSTNSNNGDVAGYHPGIMPTPLGYQPSVTSDYWMVKLDATGNIQWGKCYGGTGDDEANSVVQTKDGGYIVAGESSSTDGDVAGNNGGYDYWLVKTNAAGNIQWEKSYGGSLDDLANSVVQTTDGGYIVAGESSSADGEVTGSLGFGDYWVVKTDAYGNLQGEESLGGSNPDVASTIVQTADGGYMVAGYTSSSDGDVSGYNTINYYLGESWIVKLNSNNPLLIHEHDFTLYPNPASDAVTIRANNLQPNSYYAIFDILGTQLISGRLTDEATAISISNLGPGVYMVLAGNYYPPEFESYQLVDGFQTREVNKQLIKLIKK